MSAIGQFFRNEWYFAWPMVAMSVTAITLVIWRILLNMNAKTSLNEFLPQFQKRLDKEGVNGALKFCQSRSDMIPKRLFTAALENHKNGMAAMRRAMASAIELDVLPDLNFLLAPILGIAKIATMVGLLGTVISMIKTFTAIQESGAGGNVAGHSGAIGLALFATALGLVTAIPLVFAHVLFKGWISRQEVEMKKAAQKLLVLVQGKPAGSAMAKTPSPASETAVKAKV